MVSAQQMHSAAPGLWVALRVSSVSESVNDRKGLIQPTKKITTNEPASKHLNTLKIHNSQRLRAQHPLAKNSHTSQRILSVFGPWPWPLQKPLESKAFGQFESVSPCLNIWFSRVPWAKKVRKQDIMERKCLKSLFRNRTNSWTFYTRS